MTHEELAARLRDCIAAASGSAEASLSNLRRGPGGASRETWSSEAQFDGPGVPRLNTTLAAGIRAGGTASGSWRERVLAHLRASSEERLAIANARYLVPRGGR